MKHAMPGRLRGYWLVLGTMAWVFGAASVAHAAAPTDSILLGNDEDAVAPVAPADKGAAPAAARPAAGADAPVPGDKPDPLTLHRLHMVEQASPDNYMGANPAVSRRYLKVDRSTYVSRLGE